MKGILFNFNLPCAYRKLSFGFLFTLAVNMLFLATAQAMISVDIEKQLAVLAQGGTQPALLKDAAYRVGVFTYEDPDKTGLGNDIASLVAHEILMNSAVSSIGVIRFEGELAPDKSRSHSYFDKVERLTRAQDVTLAVWGVVRKMKDRIVIDTYVQIPETILQKSFRRDLPLPARMGGKKLLAGLRPDRFQVQHYVFPAEKTGVIRQAAKALATIRVEPDQAADIVGTVPQDKYYYFRERYGDWVNITVSKSGLGGWLPLRGHCTDECAPLIDAAVFASDLLAFISGQGMPEISRGLSTEALAVKEQLDAMQAVDASVSVASCDKALKITARWLDRQLRGSTDSQSGIRRSKSLPPGGAAFANLKAVIEVNRELQERRQSAGSQQWDNLELSASILKRIVNDLAKASQNDPRNQNVLHNLAVLFTLIGDEKRSALARQLFDQARPR